MRITAPTTTPDAGPTGNLYFPHHAAKLAACGIPEAFAAAAGIRSVTAAHITRFMFGRDANQSAPGDGLEIPYLDDQGQPVLGDDGTPYLRWRLFVEPGTDGRTLRYLTRPSAGARPYLPMGLAATFGQARYLIITEGEFKALATVHCGLACAGIGGVTLWADATGHAHAALVALVRKLGGAVVVADSDARANAEVRKHLHALCDDLRLQCPGCIIAYIACPEPKAELDAAPPAKVGLDDWLVASRPNIAAVAQLLDWAFDKEAARQAVLRVGGYVPLGFSSAGHHVWALARGRIETIPVGAVTSPGALMTVAGGLAWCQAAYGAPGRNGATVVNWQKMGGDLVAACTACGAFNADAVRGMGVWPAEDSADVLVVNSAMVFRTDGAPQERVGSTYVYPASGALGVTPTTVAATPTDVAHLLAALATWRWARPSDATLMLGWLCYAYLAGAVSWRAHLNLTGSRGTGKSLLQSFIARLLGRAALLVDGDSTEAGIRQRVGHAALALLIDEGEADGAKLARLLQFLRSASSGATVLRGTQDQMGAEFTLRVAGMVAGICPPRLAAADESRFLALELVGVDAKAAAAPHPLIADERAATELGQHLFARILQSWPRLRHAIAMLRGLVGGDPRYADGVALVLAAAWVALNDGELDVTTARQFVAGIDLATDQERVVKTQDETDLFDHLMSSSVQASLGGKPLRMTIAELCAGGQHETSTTGPHQRELGVYGMRVGTDDGRPVLLIDTRSAGLRNLFSGTRWAAGRLDASLRRLSGASRKTGRTVWIGGRSVRAEMVPLVLEGAAGQPAAAAASE
jgi:hypothetical protein